MVCVAITASGLLRQRSFYLDAGFDDFIGKPFLFETVCDCMTRHLGVVLERAPADAAPQALAPKAPDLEQVRLAPDLRARLLAAADINALTEIEALIAELRPLDQGAQALADRLQALLQRYDMDGIAALVGQIPATDTSDPA
jgi:DNA-binding response OmpR family regulator